MNIRSILLLLVLICIAVFAAVNWSVFTAPSSLSLIVTTIEAPLGLIMLGVTALLAMLALAFAAYLKTTMLVESRNHERDMRALRNLADNAEASRLIELQRFLESELRKQREQYAEVKAALLTRIDQLESNSRASIELSGNTMAAYIGELEDRLERSSGKPVPEHLG